MMLLFFCSNLLACVADQVPKGKNSFWNLVCDAGYKFTRFGRSIQASFSRCKKVFSSALVTMEMKCGQKNGTWICKIFLGWDVQSYTKKVTRGAELPRILVAEKFDRGFNIISPERISLNVATINWNVKIAGMQVNLTLLMKQLMKHCFTSLLR